MGIWIPSNTWFLGPIRVLNPNSILIGAEVFAGLTSVTDRLTDRPTDHATRSVTIGLIYVRSTAMRPNNTRPAYRGTESVHVALLRTPASFSL